MDTAFKKDTAGLRIGNGFICIKAILKYRHGWLRIGRVEGKLSCDPLQSILSRELAKQAVITKCRGISMRSQAVSLKKPWISVPKKICDNYSKVIKKSVLICDNLWTKNSVEICG